MTKFNIRVGDRFTLKNYLQVFNNFYFIGSIYNDDVYVCWHRAQGGNSNNKSVYKIWEVERYFNDGSWICNNYIRRKKLKSIMDGI